MRPILYSISLFLLFYMPPIHAEHGNQRSSNGRPIATPKSKATKPSKAIIKEFENEIWGVVIHGNSLEKISSLLKTHPQLANIRFGVSGKENAISTLFFAIPYKGYAGLDCLGKRDVKVLKLLLDAGLNVDESDLYYTGEKDISQISGSPLHFIIGSMVRCKHSSEENLEAVKLLLKYQPKKLKMVDEKTGNTVAHLLMQTLDETDSSIWWSFTDKGTRKNFRAIHKTALVLKEAGIDFSLANKAGKKPKIMLLDYIAKNEEGWLEQLDEYNIATPKNLESRQVVRNILRTFYQDL